MTKYELSLLLVEIKDFLTLVWDRYHDNFKQYSLVSNLQYRIGIKYQQI